ncbi:hypothetical protein N836_11215 [Leptolyngbya sp. Heron Island J]|uniref:hypothetical protein n=1 Tax=Leptolyngbya sp. Heron Island J TaxID=1385935 RepID=UPI0003B938FE|nr:hypothetical protein [Leptolyngbya sp. Heron Island J]ESA35560.1 hypothetical protein N836_11215 [Leptolyngbya sp. Heron Island J]
MSGNEVTLYLDRLLALYEEKLKRFRLSLTILLAGTVVFFFLIFFPYITLIGNQESCPNELDCPELYQSGLEERVSDMTTSWGNIPVSTAEVVAFFPAGAACGVMVVSAQLQGLMRLRQAITQQARKLENPVDVTLIAPLLIDPKQSFFEQILGSLTLLFPSFIVLFSINLILIRLEALNRSLPYNQNVSFYYRVYLLSSLLVIYALVKTGWNVFKSRAFERHQS